MRYGKNLFSTSSLWIIINRKFSNSMSEIYNSTSDKREKKGIVNERTLKYSWRFVFFFFNLSFFSLNERAGLLNRYKFSLSSSMSYFFLWKKIEWCDWERISFNSILWLGMTVKKRMYFFGEGDKHFSIRCNKCIIIQETYSSMQLLNSVLRVCYLMGFWIGTLDGFC